MSRRAFDPARRLFLGAAAVAAVGAWVGPPAAAQPSPGDPFRRVEPAAAPGDKPDIWTLGFEYIPPRITTVELPGGGKQAVWYMPYRVYNPTKNPQQLRSLRFELVTKDLNTTHLDEPQPSVFNAIVRKEDPGPDRIRNYKTTIGMSNEQIPVTKPDSYPRYVYGIAVWTDVPARAAKTNRFSVYVSGLSDGLTVEPTADGGKLVKVKTLQLDFFKPTDSINPGIGDIKPEDNRGLGGERWVYRATGKRPAAGTEGKKDEGK